MSIGLVCMIGLPGAGKTTLVYNLTQFIQSSLTEQNRINCTLIDYDEIDWSSNESWKEKRKEIYYRVERLIQGINKSQWDKSIIFLDDNMYYRSMRYEYYQLARKFRTGFSQIYLQIDIANALERNTKRKNRVGEEVIRRMATKLEVPDPNKYLWEENSLTVSELHCHNFEFLHNFILQCLQNPVKPIDDGHMKQEHLLTKIHCADLALRNIVATVVKTFQGKENNHLMGKKLAARRKLVMEEVKNGIIHLPFSSEESQDILLHKYYKTLFKYMIIDD